MQHKITTKVRSVAHQLLSPKSANNLLASRSSASLRKRLPKSSTRPRSLVRGVNRGHLRIRETWEDTAVQYGLAHVLQPQRKLEMHDGVDNRVSRDDEVDGRVIPGFCKSGSRNPKSKRSMNSTNQVVLNGEPHAAYKFGPWKSTKGFRDTVIRYRNVVQTDIRRILCSAGKDQSLLR